MSRCSKWKRAALAMEHGPILEVHVSASFPGSFLCPVQEAVGARLMQAFEQGRAFCPDQFTHPKARTGCLRLFLPVATSALGESFQDAVAIQPYGLLPNALSCQFQVRIILPYFQDVAT